MPFFSVLIDLLSDRDRFIQEIYDGIKVNTKIFGLLVCSSIFLAIYGGLIGAVSSWMQVLSSVLVVQKSLERVDRHRISK